MANRYFLVWTGILIILACSLVFGVNYSAGSDSVIPNPNPAPPANPVRLIFIHHSTGENWLSDNNGGLGMALRDNNYYVSDTNYGWGPNHIGDYTDIGNWWDWFRGPNSSAYLDALYNEGGQYASYSRLSTAPSGENSVILFKSCFPNSALQGNPNDPIPPIDNNPLRGEGSESEHHTVANAKGIYIDLLEYFRTRKDKLFILITAPPLSDPTYADNARAFNNWLMNDWLKTYPYNNVFVFDFYNVLTTNGGNRNTNDLGQETGNHHRWWNNTIQHKTDGGSHVSAYSSSYNDDHPSQAGNLKATGEFLDLLNIAYNLWEEVVSANTYYVAKTGNDSNPGSESQPWLSIQKAANSLMAGDTVYIKSGTYNERVIPANSGSPGNFIHYAAYPGDTVTLDGSGVSVPVDEGLFHVSGKSYIKVSGLRVTHSAQAGILAEGSSNIVIKDNYTSNTGSSGIGVWNSNNVTVNSNEVELACGNGWQEFISVAGTDTFEVKNNHVHSGTADKEGICIKDGSSNGKVYGNHVHDVEALGIYVDAWDKHTYNIDVMENVVHDISDGNGFAVACEMGGLLENVRIFNNVAYHNRFCGVSVSVNGPGAEGKHPMKNIQVINNTFYDNGWTTWGGGITIENPDAESVVVRNNISSQNLYFQIAVDPNIPAQNLTIEHNLIDGFRGTEGETRGSNYVEGNPKFVNASGADFHLQYGSPAIDAGSSVNAPSLDFDGNSRPYGNGYDIGAYEYGGTPPSTETISTPSPPVGPESGAAGASYSYSTGGSSSTIGHAVEYQFDWKGDGSDLSLWGSSTQSKAWNVAGIYNVRARARCAIDSSVVSNWSSGLMVTIGSPETISTPIVPSGPMSGTIGTLYTYSTGGSASNLGHPVQYLIDWGDGSNSGWLAVGTTSASKFWTSTGNYLVKAQARCSSDTSIVSSWSGTLSVTIGQQVCTYSISPTSANIGSGGVWGQIVNVTAEANCPWTAESNSGSWDWLGISAGWSGTGNGTVTWHAFENNSANPRSGYLTIAGQAFTVTQPGVQETVSTPTTPSGTASGTINTGYTYSIGGSSSSLGHNVQYLMDWGDGTNSGWLPVGTTSSSKFWTSIGNFLVTAQARCALDTSVVSGWSTGLTVTISGSGISIISPNGGENWKAGTTQTISWTYSDSPGNYVKIELLNGEAVNRTIAYRTSIGSSGSGSYSWRMFRFQTTGSDYKIRVTSFSDSSYTDTSDNNFTISK